MTIKYWEHRATVPFLAAYIRQGHVFIGTTDTVMGLYAPADSRGVAALNAIKGRIDKPYIVLVNSCQEAEKYVQFDKIGIIARCMAIFWPGPLTIIGRVTPLVSSELGLDYQTLAVRWPAHAGIDALLGSTAVLLSTSANFAGEPTPSKAAQLDPRIVVMVPLLVLDQEGAEGSGLKAASTIIDCSGDEVIMVRAGALATQQTLQEIVGSKIVYE